MPLSTITLPRRFAPFGHLSTLWEHSGTFSSLFGDLSDAIVPTEETPEAYTLTLPLPGFKREEITLEVANESNAEAEVNIVAVRGARKVERYVSLGALSVDPEGITAKLEDGILTLTCPKRASAKPRRIEVA